LRPALLSAPSDALDDPLGLDVQPYGYGSSHRAPRLRPQGRPAS
jgi:hypothetical protein